MIIGFVSQPWASEVNPTTHIAPHGEFFWSFTQSLLEAPAEPLLWHRQSKYRFRKSANYWGLQCRVWDVCLGFSVRGPVLDSRTRLSSVSVCQQNKRQGKYLNPNEKPFGQLFSIHLESGQEVSYTHWCIVFIEENVLIYLVNGETVVFLDGFQDLSCPPAIPDWSRLAKTLSDFLICW